MEVTVDVKKRLMDVAINLFAEKGYDATSVSDLVQAAHVTKGAMYYYFTSKEEILLAIHHQFIESEMNQAEEILSHHLSPEVTLRSLILSLIESIALYQNQVTIFFRELHRLSPASLAQVRTIRDQYEQMFERTIQAGQNSGVFRIDMEPRLLALALFGQCNWTYTWMRPAGPLTPTAIGQHFADIFLQGIAKSSPNS